MYKLSALPPKMTHPARSEAKARRMALFTLLALGGFVLCWAGAMALYPGGTFQDPKHVGQSFFGNFFCDLTQPVSLSGVRNPIGSRVAQIAMLFFAGALWAAFNTVPRFLPERSRVRPWLGRFALLSVLMFVAVPLTPSERFGSLHAVLALSSGAFGIGVMILAVRAMLASSGWVRGLGVLGALALVVGACDGVMFVQHLGDAAPAPLIVPAGQKVAAILLSAWMALLALSVFLGKDRMRD